MPDRARMLARLRPLAEAAFGDPNLDENLDLLDTVEDSMDIISFLFEVEREFDCRFDKIDDNTPRSLAAMADFLLARERVPT